MKILQVGKFYPIRGGVEKVMYDLMLGLSARQIHCDMLCASTEDHPAGDIVLNEYAKVFVVPTQLKAAATMLAPAMILKLRQLASSYDIIHIHHPDPMAALSLFLSGYKGKVILHWHADILKQKNLLKLYKPLQSWLIKRANLIVGTTPVYVKQSFFLQEVQQKIDYIPIGVLPIVAENTRIAAIKQQYAGKKLIFSLGRLVEYKGYEYLIRAAVDLSADYQIVIAGKGPLQESLQNLILQLGVQDRVTLLGFVDDPTAYAYFEACTLFCLPSILKTEAFAIVQIEAMSCGKPLVSTNIAGSGVPWVNKHGSSGLVVEPEQATELSTAIKQICEDPDLYQQLAIGAKSRFENYFTRDAMIDQCLARYNKVLAP